MSANIPIYPKTIDLNQDNIPDSWEKQYFRNALNFDTFKIDGFANPAGPLLNIGGSDRIYQEKFAAADAKRCQTNSSNAENYTKTIGGGSIVINASSNTNDYSNDNGNLASWVYHNPVEIVGGNSGTPGVGNSQFTETSTDITIWTKTDLVGTGFKMFLYYTTDGSMPDGNRGKATGTTKIVEMTRRHDQTGTFPGAWWSSSGVSKSFPSGTLFKYKIGIYRILPSTCGVLKNALLDNPISNSIQGFDVTDSGSHVIVGTGSNYFRIYNLNVSPQNYRDVAIAARKVKFYDNGNKIIACDELKQTVRLLNFDGTSITSFDLATLTGFTNLPCSTCRAPVNAYVNKIKNKAYILLSSPTSAHILCIDLSSSKITQSAAITNLPRGISRLRFDSENQPSRVFFLNEVGTQNTILSLNLNSSGLFGSNEASLSIAATVHTTNRNQMPNTDMVCIGSDIYYIDNEQFLNKYNTASSTNTVLTNIKLDSTTTSFKSWFALNSDNSYLYIYSPEPNTFDSFRLQKINLTGPSKDKVAFSTSDSKFPNASLQGIIWRQNGVFIAGNARQGFCTIQYQECVTHNSPNATYFKQKQYQLGSLSDEIAYYYESGTQTNAKGPNFIRCASGKCVLFLAPKNLSNTPYDPITAPNESFAFLEAFGSYFPRDLQSIETSSLNGLTVSPSILNAPDSFVGPVSNPAPIPWNRAYWKYDDSQIFYSQTGTVNPVFNNPINHYLAKSDADNFTNYDEFVYGTDPTNSISKAEISYNINPSNVVYFIPTAINRRYLIQTGAATNPNWSTTLTVTGDGFLKEATGLKPATNSFQVRSIADIIYPPAATRAPLEGFFIYPSYAALSGNLHTATFLGLNLETVKSVKIDNTDVKDFDVVNNTRLEINFPDINTSGKKNLYITNRSGTSIFPDYITYYVPPKIDGISQNKFPLAGGSTFVSGSGFYLLYARINNGLNLNTSSVTTTGFNATIPTQSSTGVKSLSVTARGGKTSTTIEFFAPPTINSVAGKFNSTQGNNSPKAITTIGTNFVSGYTKLFIQRPQIPNYEEITPIKVIGSNIIESPLPQSFVTGYAKIKVETFNGAYSAVLNDAIYYINEPVLTSLTPSTGKMTGGQGVIFSGQNFNPDLKAFIDYKPIINQTFVSDKIISGITPIGTSTGFKDATVSGIFSDPVSSLSFIFTKTEAYRYADPPVINMIGRLAGDHCIKTGTAANISISGKGLLVSPKTKVTIGGANANIISHATETGMTVSVPLSWNPGYSILKVNTEAGSNEDSDSHQWKLSYIGKPSISLVNPTFCTLTGRGDTIVYGTNFGTTGTMNIGNNAFFNECRPILKFTGTNTPINSFNNTELKFNAPASTTAGEKTIEISNVAGTGSINVMYLMQPVVQSVTPNRGASEGGNLITISGSGILTTPYEATNVYFDNSQVSVSSLAGTVNSASRIVVVAPARTNSSKTTVDIKITNGGGETIIQNGYGYIEPMTIQSSTEAGPLAGGNIFIASGTNIPGDTIVKFGNNQATNINIISTTGIRATVPASSNIGISTVLITGGGQAGITRSYAYMGQPIATSVTPTAGPADYNNVNLTISGLRFTLPDSNINYSSNLTIGEQNVLINSISEKSITATITGTMTTGAKNVVFSNAGGTSTLANGYTGLRYMPSYTMPSFVGSSATFVTSPTVNTLYVSYQP